MTIDLISSTDPYMYLLSGAGRNGSIVEEDDDDGSVRNSRIELRLEPGVYTVDATTHNGGRTGSFRLEIQLSEAPIPRNYAWANLYSDYYTGVKGTISTAIPGVRDGPEGFSSEVIWIKPAALAGTVEVGWRTMESPNQSPRWYTGYWDSSGMWRMEWQGSPTVGVSYEYKIERNSSGLWEISIDGTVKERYDSGMTVGRIVQAGGEVTKMRAAVDNAIGVSSFTNMQYKSTKTNTWTVWHTWNNMEIDSGYRLVQLYGSYHNFQNFGHNP